MKKILMFFYGILIPLYIQSATNSKYVIGRWPGGMGACLSSTLNHLAYCECHNLTPIVFWQGSFYHTSHGFNGKHNEWEYYFNPVSNLKYERGDTVNRFCGEQAGYGTFNYHDVSQKKREHAHHLIRKYIHLNNIVQAKVDRFYTTYMKNKNTIGIHIRGTDKYTEEKPVSPELAVATALQYADEATQFFIATDEKKLLKQMLTLLQGKTVIYYSCYRSEDGRPLHTRHAKPSPAQLGEDVLVEMWLMSQCNLLVHTLSNVSSIPLYINPELEHVTLY